MKVKTLIDDDVQKLQQSLQEAIVVQQAIHPLDQARAEGTVDGTLWKGLAKPSLLQRMGFLIFGGFFFLMGSGMILNLHEKEQHLSFSTFDVIGLGSALVGLKIMSNAFRRHRKNIEHD